MYLTSTLLKVTLLNGCFSLILNCTTDTKSRNASHVKLIKLHPINISSKSNGRKEFEGHLNRERYHRCHVLYLIGTLDSCSGGEKREILLTVVLITAYFDVICSIDLSFLTQGTFYAST